jgi:hypothetical protein
LAAENDKTRLVFERIETDPTKPPSRIVAKQMCHKTVRCLVKSNGDDYRDNPDRDQINSIGSHCLNASIDPMDGVGSLKSVVWSLRKTDAPFRQVSS